MENMHKMSLHDTIQIKNGPRILRVPGGWHYIYSNNCVVFQEFDYEFKAVQNKNKLTLKIISDVVRSYYKLPKNFLTVKSRNGDRPIAKQLITKIATEELGLSQQVVSDYVGYSNRSQVTYSLKKIENMIKYNQEINIAYDKIMRKLK